VTESQMASGLTPVFVLEWAQKTSAPRCTLFVETTPVEVKRAIV